MWRTSQMRRDRCRAVPLRTVASRRPLNDESAKPPLGGLAPVRSGGGRNAREQLRPRPLQPPSKRIIDARAYDELLTVGALVDNFPAPVNLREQLSVGCRQPDLGQRPSRPHRRAEGASQRLEPTIVHGGHEYRVLHQSANALLEREQLLFAQEVDLVEHEKARPIADSELLENLLNNDPVVLPLRVTR